VSQRQEQKDVALAYALWCLSLVGLCGVQRLYLGQVGYGLILLLTFGFCGVAQLLDLILLPDAVGQSNRSNAIRALAPRPSSTPVRAATPAPARPAAPAPPPARPAASAPAVRGAQDDDLDSLLREAQRSIERTDQPAEP
jgi:TM2 domain-containing membrane protein YozV